MAVTGQDVVRVARSWVGTPFHHGGRLKGIGIDCVGLITSIGRELGLSEYDETAYAPYQCSFNPNYLLEKGPLLNMARVAGEPQPGDVLILNVGGIPQHCAVWTGEGTVIHAFAMDSHPQGGVCVASHLEAGWRERVHSIWRWKGVED